MGKREVDGRVGAPTEGPAPSPRPQTPTVEGPFGGAQTKLADAASIRNLIEKSAQVHDDDRQTREMDPKQFAAVVRRSARTPPKGAPIVAPVAPAAPAAPANLDAELDAAFADPDVAGITANEHAALAVTVDTTAMQAELAAAAAAAVPPEAPDAIAEPTTPATDEAPAPTPPAAEPTPMVKARGPSPAIVLAIVLAIFILGAIAVAGYVLALT